MLRTTFFFLVLEDAPLLIRTTYWWYCEILVANMTEFVILLGGCKQMHKRPYDTYIYIDNFMFSRLVEKAGVDQYPIAG